MAKKELELIKVTCIVPYFDLLVQRNVKLGDSLEVAPVRAKELISKGLVK